MDTIRELCSFEGRLAGTDAERRAADRLTERLRSLGRRADAEPTYVHPQAPPIHAAHCTIAVRGKPRRGRRAGRRVRPGAARRGVICTST